MTHHSNNKKRHQQAPALGLNHIIRVEPSSDYPGKEESKSAKTFETPLTEFMGSSNFSIDSDAWNPFKTDNDEVDKDKTPTCFVAGDNDDRDTSSTTDDNEEEEDQFQCKSSFSDPFVALKVKQHDPKTHDIFSDEAPSTLETPRFQKAKATPREIFFDPNDSEAMLPAPETFMDQPSPIKHNDDDHHMVLAASPSPSPAKDSSRSLKKTVDRWQENPGSDNEIAAMPIHVDHTSTLNPPKKDTMPYSPRRVVSRMTKLPTALSSPPLTHNDSADGNAVEGRLSLIQEIMGIVSNDSDELKAPRRGRKKDDTSSNHGGRRSRSTSRGRIKDEAAIRHGRRRSRSSSCGRVKDDADIRHGRRRSRSSSRGRIKVDEATPPCRRGRKTTNNVATSSSHDRSVSNRTPSKCEDATTISTIDHPTSPAKIPNDLQVISPGVSSRSDKSRSVVAATFASSASPIPPPSPTRTLIRPPSPSRAPIPPPSPSRKPPPQSRVRRARSDTANPATMPARSPRAYRGRRVVSGDLTGLQVALGDDSRKEASTGRANREVSHTTINQSSPSNSQRKSSSQRRSSRSRSRQDRRRKESPTTISNQATLH